MTLYAESSAILGWVLRESSEAVVREALSSAELVFVSDLCLLEVDRGLRASTARGRLDSSSSSAARQLVAEAATDWTILPLNEQVLAGARRDFPIEPVRALDALHLASASLIRAELPACRMLSLDQRIRRNAEALGFQVVP